MPNNKNILITLFLIGMSVSILFAQTDKKSKKALFNEAKRFFDDEMFFEALPAFLEYDSIYPNEFESNYYIGACYLNTKYQKKSAIPYFDFAIKKNKEAIPPAVFIDVGRLYLETYQFKEAKENFNYAKEISGFDLELKRLSEKMLQTCDYAEEHYNDSSFIKIKRVENPINSDNIEFAPFISADNASLYFTRTYKKNIGTVITDSLDKIMVSNKLLNEWTEPSEVKIDFPDNIIGYNLAGMSPDGQRLFISLHIDTVNYDLYTCLIENDSCKYLYELGGNVNSKYKENYCSISPDGERLFFSSNRVGGYGGFDVYCSEYENGEWGNPTNVGNSINTEQTEQAPFIHPDGLSLYFSSDGHQTMGGLDIFKSILDDENRIWTIPENLGYPLNSTSDDNNFVTSAKGDKVYFSSTKESNDETFDIFYSNLKSSIPLTLVKGIILDESNKPIKARIIVIDKETNQKVKYIYSPNPKTGKYLMIFPPNKEYRIVIEAEGHLAHSIDILIPDQNYFYELYQEIYLKKVRLSEFDEVVGEELVIKNAFYDVYANNTDTVNGATNKDYTKLLNVIDQLINYTDTVDYELIDNITSLDDSIKIQSKEEKINDLINIIEDAFQESDTTILKEINNNTRYNEKTSRTYFYDYEDKGKDLTDLIVNGDTIKVLPVVDTKKVLDNNDNVSEIKTTNDNDYKKLTQLNLKETKVENRKYILKYKVYFQTNKTKIKGRYKSRLEEIAELLIDNPDLGVEILGYTDTYGKSEYNLLLSELRAREVMQYLVQFSVNPHRIILQGYGETKSLNEKTESDKQKNRRVEIIVFQVINSKKIRVISDTLNNEINKVYPFNTEKQQDKIIYKIQIVSSKVPLTRKNKQFKGLNVTEYRYGERYNYVFGEYNKKNDAFISLKQIIDMGFKGAFIVEFIEGKRVN